MKSDDSFQVDMEPFSHITNNNKDITFNSRFSLQRCLSRKGEDKKMRNPSVDDEKNAISSPKAIMSEKSIPVTIEVGEPHVHHQISIVTAATTIATESPTKSRLIGKRSSSFKQSSIINPRRIMCFFATLSSMGTILLIYFTLTMAKHNGDEYLLDQY
ncbi:uncharacterized protein [Rutidosis leptorrhynchoides]